MKYLIMLQLEFGSGFLMVCTDHTIQGVLLPMQSSRESRILFVHLLCCSRLDVLTKPAML